MPEIFSLPYRVRYEVPEALYGDGTGDYATHTGAYYASRSGATACARRIAERDANGATSVWVERATPAGWKQIGRRF